MSLVVEIPFNKNIRFWRGLRWLSWGAWVLENRNIDQTQASVFDFDDELFSIALMVALNMYAFPDMWTHQGH